MSERKEIQERFSDDEEVDRAIKDAVRDTLARHGRLGQNVVVWLDNRPVWINPETPPHGETEDPSK